jgi:RNA polymerase sigma-70 factor (ECF subfamily)
MLSPSPGAKVSRSAKPRLEELFEQAYSDGYGVHGDLALEAEVFAEHLTAIAAKHLGPGVPRAVTLSFIDSLHTCDVYLAAACAQHSAAAWSRFMTLYQKYLKDIALSVSPNSDAAGELADSVLVELFLSDRSGHSRIASYHGRSSLATWLRVIVCHRAINERERKDNSLERIESIIAVAVMPGVRNLEAVFRSLRYEDMIEDSLRKSCNCLTDRERLLLLLRYDEELQVSQIARLLGVCPSTVTRQLERVQGKLRENVVSTLASTHNLQQDAIEECLVDLLDNPSHSILALIKEC